MHTTSRCCSVLLLLVLVLGPITVVKAEKIDQIQAQITLTVSTFNSNVVFSSPSAGAGIDISHTQAEGPGGDGIFQEEVLVPPLPFPARVEFDESTELGSDYALGEANVNIAQRELFAQSILRTESSSEWWYFEGISGGGAGLDLEYTGYSSAEITITAEWSYSIDFDDALVTDSLFIPDCLVMLGVDLREYDGGYIGSNVLGSEGDFLVGSNPEIAGPELWTGFYDEAGMETREGTAVWTYVLLPGKKFNLAGDVETAIKDILVPEPATMSLLLVGGGILLRRKRK